MVKKILLLQTFFNSRINGKNREKPTNIVLQKKKRTMSMSENRPIESNRNAKQYFLRGAHTERQVSAAAAAVNTSQW